MKETLLFYSNKGNVTDKSLKEALKLLITSGADILYIHTALNFGIPNNEIRKKELLDILLDLLMGFNVNTIIFPAYTFSFCNGVNFNVKESRTPMGLLNDYARLKEYAIRSVDPLMSNVLIGGNKEFVTKIGKCSVGEDSTFDLLHKSGLNVKFLFFGPRPGDCFTYMHYIEERENVPYRYNRTFTGEIINGDNKYEESYELFVRFSNVKPGLGSYAYETILLERMIARKQKIGDSSITLIDEKGAYETYQELIRKYPNFFLDEPFEDAAKTTLFEVKNMVAL